MAQGSRVLETAAAQTGNRRTSRAEQPQQHSRAQARRRNYAAQGRRRATRRPTQLLRLWVLASPQDLGPVPEPVPAGEPSSATTTEQRKNYVAHAVHTFHTHYLSLVSSERSVHNAPSPTVLTSRSHYKSGVKHWSQKLKFYQHITSFQACTDLTAAQVKQHRNKIKKPARKDKAIYYDAPPGGLSWLRHPTIMAYRVPLQELPSLSYKPHKFQRKIGFQGGTGRNFRNTWPTRHGKFQTMKLNLSLRH